jgi:DNA-binding PadR family transcriptional regulator
MSMTPLSPLEQWILLSLVRLGPEENYGVPVRTEIRERTGWEPSLAAVYAGLARLEDAGLVGSRISDPLPQRGGRARKHYHLLPQGAQAVLEARSRMDRMWADVELDPLADGAPGDA